MEYTKWDNLNHKFNIGELRAAAESGDADAQYELGFCYMSGLGVEEDAAQAAAWYGKAAEQGNAHAQCSLGNFYKEGYGLEQDEAMAVR